MERKWKGVVRVIRKKHQVPVSCHHLQAVLERTPNSMILSSFRSALPRQLRLKLELSINKQEKKDFSGYYCTQCGKYFREDEFMLYQKLFSKAKFFRADVWKLKSIFENRNGKGERELLREIVPWRQRYSCELSRLEECGMILKDEEMIYDEVMKKFGYKQKMER